MRNRVWAGQSRPARLAAGHRPGTGDGGREGPLQRVRLRAIPVRLRLRLPRGGHRLASGVFRLREGKNRSDSVFFSLDRIAFREVHTNPENGKWFSVRGHSLFNEVRARRVEGSLFELRNIEAGQPFVLEDSSGNLVLRDLGVVRQTILFDTAATMARGDVHRRSRHQPGRPHPRFTGDLCEIATRSSGHDRADALAAVAVLVAGLTGACGDDDDAGDRPAKAATTTGSATASVPAATSGC